MERNSNNHHRGTGHPGRGRDGGGNRGGGRGGFRGWGAPAQSGGQHLVDRAGGQYGQGGGSYRPPQQQTGGGQGVGPTRVESIGVHGSGGYGGGRGGGGAVWNGRPGLHTRAPQSQPQQQTGGQGVDPTRGESSEVHGNGGYGSTGGGRAVWGGRPGLHTQPSPRSQSQATPGRNIPCLDLGKANRSNYVSMEFCTLVEAQGYPKEKLPREKGLLLKKISMPSPKERKSIIYEMVHARDGPCGYVVRNFEMAVDKNMTRVIDRVLVPPALKLRTPTGKLQVITVERERCQLNLIGNSVVEGKPLERWALIDLSFNNRFRLKSGPFIQKLRVKCKDQGIPVEEPVVCRFGGMKDISTLSSTQELLDGVVEEANKKCNGRLQLFVCVMSEKHDLKYLKWVSETRIGIMTQCCFVSQANNPDKRKSDQYLANLALKINAKLGGSNVELVERLPGFPGEEHVMFIGADVNHPGPGTATCPSFAAVVATTNWPAVSRCVTRICAQEHRKEKIVDFGATCLDLVNTYAHLKKNVKPQKIVVFRDGVSEAQFDMVLNEELQDMKSAIYTDDYRPTITVIVAQKRHLTRMFVENEKDGGSSGNVPPGGVVDTKIIGKMNGRYTEKHICRQLAVDGESTEKCIRRQHGTRRWLFKQSAIGLPDGGYMLSLLKKKIVRETFKRKCRNMSVLSLEYNWKVDSKWEDSVKSTGVKHIYRQLVIHFVSRVKSIRRQHGFHRWPFQQCGKAGESGPTVSNSEKGSMREALKRDSLRDLRQHFGARCKGAAKGLWVKHIYRQLVSRAKNICGQHGFHRWPFQPNWATLKGYFLGDERPVAVISLSMDGKLVSRLQLIHISWLGRFLPRPPALPPGGEIVEPPLALSSSQLPSTSNRAHLGGQDRSGSTTSHSQNERTRDQPEGRKRKIKNLTIEDLRPYVGLTRADAAKKFQMSETTFKRQCRRLKIGQWPKLPPGEEILKPPDPPERNTRQIEMVNKLGHLPNPIEVRKPLDPHERTTRETVTENEVVGDFHGPNELLQDCFDGSICWNIENDSTTEILETPTIRHYMDIDFIRSATEETEEARGSHERAFQVIIDELTMSTAYPHPNPVVMQPQVASTHIVSGNMGIPNDQSNSTIPRTMVGSECWSDWLAFFEDSIQEEHVFGFIDCTVPSCSDPAPSHPISTIAPTMPEIPLTENEDTGSVELKATYGDTIIKFQLPPMFGISELKEEVSKRREFELGSYKIEYKDAEGDWTLIACNDDIRRYLQQLKSFGKQVIELRVRDEVPNTTNSCEFCGSLTRERP